MLPALVMSCLRAGLARARYIFWSGSPKTFRVEMLSRPLLFLCLFGTHSHNLNPGIMSRQIYYEENRLCSCGHRSPGIAVPFAGVVPIRTVRPLNLVGIVLTSISIYVIPAVLSFLRRPAIYSVTISSFHPGRFRVGGRRMQSPWNARSAPPRFSYLRMRATETNSS